MKRIVLFAVVVSGGISTLVSGKPADKPDLQLSVASIVEKNVEARGGLKAWHRIKTMAWIGHIDIESTKAPVHDLPFVLKMKRPNKTRFEIAAQHRLSLRLFDGKQGWKVRPGGQDGMPELKPYSQDELSFARDAQGFDGPLIDYRSKGIKVALEGTDQIEGRQAYRLEVIMPSGNSHHVWIDAASFLDVRYDRKTRNAFGMTATLSMTYRDYRQVGGLWIPFTIESATGNGGQSYKMVLDKVELNPTLSDLQFSKPNIPHRRNNRIKVEALPPHAGWRMRPLAPGSFPSNTATARESGRR